LIDGSIAVSRLMICCVGPAWLGIGESALSSRMPMVADTICALDMVDKLSIASFRVCSSTACNS
jgi:hypothetical protein